MSVCNVGHRRCYSTDGLSYEYLLLPRSVRNMDRRGQIRLNGFVYTSIEVRPFVKYQVVPNPYSSGDM